MRNIPSTDIIIASYKEVWQPALVPGVLPPQVHFLAFPLQNFMRTHLFRNMVV